MPDPTADVLVDIPAPGERRIAVRVTKDALRHVRSGHPWIYDGAVTSESHAGAPGDLAVVFDDRRAFAAIGLWDPTSPIRVRVLHHGDPETIDDDFWTGRLLIAAERRRPLADDPRTTGYRCINGESDGFPGLVLDRYADTAVLKLYTAAWLPHLRSLLPLIVDLHALERVVLRMSRAVQSGPTSGLAEATTVHGTAPTGPVLFQEHGLTFEADTEKGQKTGHFLDQRENRALVGSLAAGARVLDVFASTGGFSVHAAAGGAQSVRSVDISAPTLAAASRNMAHNAGVPAVAACRHDGVVGDAFDVLRDLARRGVRHDIVVIDPPSFASSASQTERAVRSYGHLTELGLGVLEPGGLLVQSSCSSRVDEATFHDVVRTAAQRASHSLEEQTRTTHALDHPATFPEARYLKTLFARLGR